MNDSALPAKWEGTWEGELRVWKPDNTEETITMRLVVELVTETTHTWRIEYLTDKQHSVRAYEIAPGDAHAGHFIIDEKNGILLDCRLFDNVMVSHFQVADVLLHSRCELRGEVIDMEIVTYSATELRRNVSDEEETEVLSYACRAFQRGLLRRA